MRIVKLDEFLELPNGILYMDFTPCIFSEFRIKKGRDMGKDFVFDDIQTSVDSQAGVTRDDILFEAVEDSSISIPLWLDGTARDGLACYQDVAYFAVYEKVDIDNLIERLKGCVGG